MPKTLTRKQLESRKEKAARFVKNVLGDPNRADEIADESLGDYAERRHIKIAENPRRLGVNCMPTKEELLSKIKELEEENDELQDQLDQVADIVAPVEEDEDEDDSDDDGDNDQGND